MCDTECIIMYIGMSCCGKYIEMIHDQLHGPLSPQSLVPVAKVQ